MGTTGNILPQLSNPGAPSFTSPTALQLVAQLLQGNGASTSSPTPNAGAPSASMAQAGAAPQSALKQLMGLAGAVPGAINGYNALASLFGGGGAAAGAAGGASLLGDTSLAATAAPIAEADGVGSGLSALFAL
jgi:hypothetical protein